MTVPMQRHDLHQAIDRLPDSSLVELAKFIEFLKFKTQFDEQTGQEPLSPRVLGLHHRQGWISEDFNDPLPDTFWLGE